MAAQKTDGSTFERLRREWMEQAGVAFEKMFGTEQQKDLVTFTQREDRVMDLRSGQRCQEYS